MSKSVSLCLALCLISALSGYFYRAYTQKPQILEVPKNRNITRTIYKDGKVSEVVREDTKFDTDAALKLKEKRNLVQLGYGLQDKREIYSLSFSRSLFPNIYIGAQVLGSKSGLEGVLLLGSWTF